MSTPDTPPAGGSMLNIGVIGTALSSYYLADTALFLHEQRDHTGAGDAQDGIRHARRELRRLTADIDETSTLGQARSRVLNWLGCFGWRFPARPATLEEPGSRLRRGRNGPGLGPGHPARPEREPSLAQLNCPAAGEPGGAC